MRKHTTAVISASALAVGLAACGGSGSSTSASTSAPQPAGDQAQITQIIKDYGKHPQKLCTTYATAHMLKAQFFGKRDCLNLASSPAAVDNAVIVGLITVNGPKAVAIRVSGTNPGKGTKSAIYLVKSAGTWKVDRVAPLGGKPKR